MDQSTSPLQGAFDFSTTNSCQCGCGKPVSAKSRFSRGHQKILNLPPPPPNPGGICMCGCGKEAPIAPRNSTLAGTRKGHPQRFCKGHKGEIPLHLSGWKEKIRLCACGCGQVAPERHRYAKGHEFKSCTIEGCTAPLEAKGWCGKHYQRWRFTGDPLGSRPHSGGTLLQPITTRFWTKTREVAGCWEWQGTCHPSGYGEIGIKGKTYRAHRIAWELVYGQIPEGEEVMHLCHNPCCVNPKHLKPGSHQENMEMMAEAGRQQQGEGHWRAKLTDSQVREIRAKYVPRVYTQEMLAVEYSVTRSMVCMIVNNQNWTHLLT